MGHPTLQELFTAVVPGSAASGVAPFTTLLDYPQWSRNEMWPRRLNKPGHFVYRWYDDEDVLLYVGVARLVRKRTNQHRWNSPWFRFIEYGCIDQFSDDVVQVEAESQMIAVESPVFNRLRLSADKFVARRRAYLLRRQAWDELRHDVLDLPWHRFADPAWARDRGYL